MNRNERDKSDIDEMLEEYNFSHAKPGRHRGFKGKLICKLADGTDRVIELKPKDDRSTNCI